MKGPDIDVYENKLSCGIVLLKFLYMVALRTHMGVFGTHQDPIASQYFSFARGAALLSP